MHAKYEREMHVIFSTCMLPHPKALQKPKKLHQTCNTNSRMQTFKTSLKGGNPNLCFWLTYGFPEIGHQPTRSIGPKWGHYSVLEKDSTFFLKLFHFSKMNMSYSCPEGGNSLEFKASRMKTLLVFNVVQFKDWQFASIEVLVSSMNVDLRDSLLLQFLVSRLMFHFLGL